MSEKALKGIRFPFGVSTAAGRVRSAEGTEQIESCLRLLLVVDPGSRPMLRTYGIGIQSMLQEPNDEGTQNLFRRLIFEGITRWEPRVSLNSVDFSKDEELGFLHVVLHYELTNSGEALVSDFSFNIG